MIKQHVLDKQQELESAYPDKTVYIRVWDVVFLQSSEDYNSMCAELDSDYDPNGYMDAWIDEDKLIDYLLQWYDGDIDHYPYNDYDANCHRVNSEFLGYQTVIDNCANWLLSHNPHMGYAGLSYFDYIVK